MTPTERVIPASDLRVGDTIVRRTPNGYHELAVNFVTADAACVGPSEFVTVIRAEGRSRTLTFDRDETVRVIRKDELGHKGRSWSGR